MRINLKAVMAISAIAFTVTGWALFITKQNQLKTLNQEKQEEKCCETVPPIVDAVNQINADLKQQQRFVWEINVRDAMIDDKNKQIEKLDEDIDHLIKANEELAYWIKQYEDYADANEEYMNALEKELESKKKKK